MSGKTDKMRNAMAAKLDVPRVLVDAVIEDADVRRESTVRLAVGATRVLFVRPEFPADERAP